MFYSAVLIPPHSEQSHTRGSFRCIGTSEAGLLFCWNRLFFCSVSYGSRTIRRNEPTPTGMVWWCWNRLFCCSVSRGSEQSEQTGCWVVPFRVVISTHCTDGVSFARISLLGWVWSSGGSGMYPPRLLALYAKDSGVIHAVVCCCGAGISLFHFALGSFDGWYPDG